MFVIEIYYIVLYFSLIIHNFHSLYGSISSTAVQLVFRGWGLQFWSSVWRLQSGLWRGRSSLVGMFTTEPFCWQEAHGIKLYIMHEIKMTLFVTFLFKNEDYVI